jgi:hypothetical protein
MNRETIKKSLVVSAVVMVIVIIAGYSYYASHSIINGPTITLSSPLDSQIDFSTTTVKIEGIALRTQSITLNGRPIVVDESGNFSEIVLLSPGYNVETLIGTDKFGQSTTISRELIYNPQ